MQKNNKFQYFTIGTNQTYKINMAYCCFFKVRDIHKVNQRGNIWQRNYLSVPHTSSGQILEISDCMLVSQSDCWNSMFRLLIES